MKATFDLVFVVSFSDFPARIPWAFVIGMCTKNAFSNKKFISEF